MAMRRPRIKASVNLAPRRTPVATAATAPKSPVKEKLPDVVEAPPEVAATTLHPEAVADNKTDEISTNPVDQNQPVSNIDALESIPALNVAEEAPKASEDVPKPPAVKLGTRRIIKPAVCLPIRKRKPPPTSAAETPSSIDVPLNPVHIQPAVASIDTPDAPEFKPPFLSPSMHNVQQQQKRNDAFVHNPFGNGPTSVGQPQQPAQSSGVAAAPIDENRNYDHRLDDASMPPQSPNKVRQRIRPTPCFALHRRNSMTQVGRCE